MYATPAGGWWEINASGVGLYGTVVLQSLFYNKGEGVRMAEEMKLVLYVLSLVLIFHLIAGE